MTKVWDAIVIGSGIGGLASAGLLAAVGGKRVLVLEKHTEPGGLTHTFRRDGAEWDVGLHYVGELGQGSLARKFFDLLSQGHLHWNRMPERFDRFVYPQFDFRVPSDKKIYLAELIERYPHEEKALKRYFRDLERCQKRNILDFTAKFLPGLRFFLGPLLLANRRLALQTTGSYLDQHFQDSQLKALLVTHWGDYGLPPSQSSFAIHALITTHYFEGAWFPQGGSHCIARTIESLLEAYGGRLLTGHEVTQISYEKGKITGVMVRGRNPYEPEQFIQAPLVISDAGAQLTYTSFLPESFQHQKILRLRKKIAKLTCGGSAVTLYLRLKDSARTLGVTGENLWLNRSFDHNDLEGQAKDLLEGNPRHGFLSFPSLKSGKESFFTAEITAFVDDKYFQAGKGRPRGNRGAVYDELKDRISRGLIALADQTLPGFKDLVIYQELSTPLTVEHYTSHPQGRFYGLPAQPELFQGPKFGPETPLKGLFLAGEDSGSLGIVGALLGGVAATAQALGAGGFFKIMAAANGAKLAPRNPLTQIIPEGKFRSRLVRSTRVAPDVQELCWQVPSGLVWSPGQYLKIAVGPWDWREYSIVACQEELLTVLVGLKTGGKGPQFALYVQPGTEVMMEGPLGTFCLSEQAQRHIFLATGTGIAPFIPMLGQLRQQGRLSTAELWYGYRNTPENLYERFFQQFPDQVQVWHHRSDFHLEFLDFDPSTTAFYICGSGTFVAECRKVLQPRGQIALYTEEW